MGIREFFASFWESVSTHGLGVLLRIAGVSLPPRLEFGSAVQKNGSDTVSWWHVFIRIKKPMFFEEREIRNAKIFVLIRDQRWQMRFLTSDLGTDTVTQATISYGDTVIVPVVKRTENNDRAATITDDRYFIGRSDLERIDAGIGKEPIKLIVRYGEKEQESQTYYLRVREEKSNGRFRLEESYSEGGTQTIKPI